MTTVVPDLHGPGDAALIAAVRDGDSDAYGLLFERHVGAARRLAGQLVPGPDADDLVSEAFAKVLVVLQRGGGPDLAFRAYLLTAVRRLHVDRIRTTSRVRVTDDLTPFDPGVPFRDSAVEGFESAAAARAFASLPERWQLVLWHTEVEEQRPAEVAVLLDLSPNSVSALAYRAREGLRQAFLAMHVSPDGGRDDVAACHRTRTLLGSYVRGAMSRRDATKVEAHLETCRPCAAILIELTEVNDHLAGLLAPALLGAAAAAYVSTGTGVLGTAGVVVALLDRAKDVVVAHAVGSSVAGAAATAVIGSTVMVSTPPEVDPPAAVDLPPTQIREPEPAPPPRAATPERGPTEAVPGPAPADASPQPSPPSASPTPSPPTASLVPSEDTTDPVAPSEPTSPSADPTDLSEPSPDTEPEVIDLALSTEVERSDHGATTIRITVLGLSGGRTATLTSRGEGVETARSDDPRCDLDDTAIGSCVVTADPAPYVFWVTAAEEGSVTFSVALDGEGHDADPVDNTVQVAVS